MQIFQLDPVLVEQIEELRAATLRPWGDKGAGVQLLGPMVLGNDYKMTHIQLLLAGSSCTWRSPTWNVPMTMFDLVIRHPALRRDGSSIVAAILAARNEERSRGGRKLSADEHAQLSRERMATFGGLSSKALLDLASTEPPRLPLGCATTKQLQTQQTGRGAREAFGGATVPVTPLHALKKNTSKVMYEATLDHVGGADPSNVERHAEDATVLRVWGPKGEAQAAVKAPRRPQTCSPCDQRTASYSGARPTL